MLCYIKNKLYLILRGQSLNIQVANKSLERTTWININNEYLMPATTKQLSQQYQLKLAVIHHPSLMTVQLIQFLQNQANYFLNNNMPQYIKGDQRFVNVMEGFHCQNQQLSEYSFEQYVGLLVIYSTSSQQSYGYFLKNMQCILGLQIGDLFITVIEMDNSDKQANLIGNQGERFCTKNQLQFSRLSLYNSQDLISVVNRNLYELIQNYYYPNQQSPQIRELTGPKQNGTSGKQMPNPPQSNQKVSEYVFSYDQSNPKIKALDQSYSPSKYKMQQMLNHAVSLRRSRQKQILIQQQQLDDSIQNVQKVLNNINHRIKQKLKSGWFTSIRDNLYMATEKSNQNFSKIKLTQEFIEQEPKKTRRAHSSTLQSRYSDLLNQSSKVFAFNFNTLNFSANVLKNPLLKLILFFSQENNIQLEVYDHSTYEQLSSISLKRLGLKQSQKNAEIMIQKIKSRIQGFSKQFQRAIQLNQQKRIQQRSYLKFKVNQQQ